MLQMMKQTYRLQWAEDFKRNYQENFSSEIRLAQQTARLRCIQSWAFFSFAHLLCVGGSSEAKEAEKGKKEKVFFKVMYEILAFFSSGPEGGQSV